MLANSGLRRMPVWESNPQLLAMLWISLSLMSTLLSALLPAKLSALHWCHYLLIFKQHWNENIFLLSRYFHQIIRVYLFWVVYWVIGDNLARYDLDTCPALSGLSTHCSQIMLECCHWPETWYLLFRYKILEDKPYFELTACLPKCTKKGHFRLSPSGCLIS